MIVEGFIGIMLQWIGASTIGLLIVCSLIRLSNIDNIHKRQRKKNKRSYFVDADKIA